ncbi:hypothetical protein [Nocardioides coralli]|uniref:hypothetical protein n=1 Tax=Nocardioides coralli TaxID=2872154 RepID=UPI001CA435B9|nr:hypothetical protein [Nocardioides coralli]QZY28336.1 hypothetical protein K6T13_12750 [Nocardioides coralli]
MIRRLVDRDLRRLSRGLEDAFPVTTPQPSAELLALLEPELLTKAGAAAEVPDRRVTGRRWVAAWIVGLGATGQTVLGTSLALAAGVGAGVADVLPDPVQQVFDRATVLLSPDGIVDDSPVPPRGPSVEDDQRSVSRPAIPPTGARDERERSTSVAGRASAPTSTTERHDSPGSAPAPAPQSSAPAAPAPQTGQGPQGSGDRDEREDGEDRAADAAEDRRDQAEDEQEQAQDLRDDARDAAEDAADDAANDDK